MDARPVLSCTIGTEAREGDGEEALFLKFGEEVGKKGDDRRLRLEFMEVEEAAGTQQAPRSLAQFVWFSVLLLFLLSYPFS